MVHQLVISRAQDGVAGVLAPTGLIVEVTGNENKLRAFLSLIETFGISELARTGTVSLRRGMLDD